MEILVSLGRTLGFSLTSGVNLYATVAVLGLAARFQFVTLPPQYQVFNNDWVIGAALLMYAVEFVADKIPIVDHLWNVVQTLLRPVAGALLMLAAASGTSTWGRIGLAAAGAFATLAAHFAKSTTRLTSTAATRGVAQIAMSLAEDVFAVALGALVFFVPWFAGIFLGALLVLLIADRRRVRRALAVLFFRLKHPRRARTA